jgi:hypothetical protein
MGIRNRERRRTNKQRRGAREHTRAAKFSAGYNWGGATGQQTDPSYLVDMMLLDASHAGCEGRDPGPVLAELTDRDAGSAWCALVTARVATALIGPLTDALHSGWEPRDLSAILRRKVGVSASDLVAAVLPDALRSHRPDPVRGARWEAQVSELGADARRLATASPTWETDVCTAVTALGFLSHLGALPVLTKPTPRAAARPDLDPSLLDKVRALLAKAEATAFEEESDAFLSKAQELMTRHNLDRAILFEADQGGVAGIEARRCWLDDPYLKQKGFLLAVVAGANRCRSVSLYEYGFVTLFGHPDDLSTAEMLFTALLVHATKQMTRPLSAGKRDASRPSYRRSFLLAYASRIGARLREATTSATDAALESIGNSLLPVLAERERGVDEALRRMFPNTTEAEVSITDRAGWAAGQAAADLVDLSWQPKLTGATA